MLGKTNEKYCKAIENLAYFAQDFLDRKSDKDAREILNSETFWFLLRPIHQTNETLSDTNSRSFTYIMMDDFLL
ncbi:CLUMA_CG017933, isoform A [Clunio marinus]|uniref:CLUMA_CG017933, isoform A n=1 Tax=Clunio marinus TaxID=568069 RepID=A0A1J1IYW7_9DIPT|nr:CLUMA_CG017933, isoform A [Clunio marinus]